MILISGENGSGKSAYAEKLTAGLGGRRFYIATMQPSGTDGAARVQKHRQQREGLGFVTLELPYSVANAAIAKPSVVLLEDVSNLLANAMFEKRMDERAVYRDIIALSKRCKMLVAVTISEFEPGDYGKETQGYIAALHRLNDMLYTAADTALIMQDGTAELQKGRLPCI